MQAKRRNYITMKHVRKCILSSFNPKNHSSDIFGEDYESIIDELNEQLVA